ncbi:Uncharacterised protein [Mycobacteroides abscessus]|nr:Uncharacterised protein [Mycobacteroides abscessus]
MTETPRGVFFTAVTGELSWTFCLPIALTK